MKIRAINEDNKIKEAPLIPQVSAIDLGVNNKHKEINLAKRLMK